MKRVFFLLIAMMGLGSAGAQTNVIDEVIWVIGDDAILRSDVEKMRLQLQMEDDKFKGDPYCVIPEQMAIQKLYVHQAKLDSIEISESRVSQQADAAINRMIARVGSSEKLEEYSGKSLSALREEWKREIREQELVREEQMKLVGDIKVSPSEVRAFFNRIPQDSLPFIPTSVEVEIITREPVISYAETDDIKRRLREYTEQVTSGQRDFSTLARLWSEDKESAVRGGEIGFRGKAELLSEFASAAFELNDPRKVSRIVETEYGYHIIQLIERRGDRINVRHILLRPKVSDKEITSAIEQLDSIRTRIVNNEITFEEGATYLSHDKDSRSNKGLMMNTESGSTTFQMDQLPVEIALNVDKMNVGDVSMPFKMQNSKDKTVVAIVKLKSRVEGHKANLADDFQILKSMVEDEKQSKILSEWITNKIRDTYIRINDEWKNCDFQMSGWVR